MRKKFVWLLVSLIVIVPLLAISCGGGTSPTGSTSPTGTATSTIPTLKIGETAKGTGVEATVITANLSDSYTYYSQVDKQDVTKTAGADMTFLIINAHVKNTSTITQPSGAGWFYVTDSEGHEYRLMPYYGEDGMVSDRYLIPGGEINGKALFLIRKAATGVKIIYTQVAEWSVN